MAPEAVTPEFFNGGDAENFPGTLGIKALEFSEGHSLLELELEKRHMNYMGSVHGGVIASLADTAAGYGTFANLPADATGFTTIELKCNFMRGATIGTVLQSTGKRIHNGRTTQVWDANVVEKDSQNIVAEFRCTNIILYSQ